MGRGDARLGASALALVLALASGPLRAAEPACSQDEVFLRAPSGQVARFAVEVADDAAERALGLMHRPRMAASQGMLFVYPAPQRTAFWMKDTLIALDMIFFDAEGRATRVHDMARPLDETPIEGGKAVQFVLEINGGLARAMGLGEGTVLRHPAVAPVGAAWPCAGG